MRPLNSALVFAAIALLGSNVLVACSASGEFPEADDASPGEPAAADEQGEDAGQAPILNGNQADATVADAFMATHPADAGKDAHKDAKSDAKTPDAADAQVIETGADAGPVGSPCAVKDSMQKQACGFCGFQTRVCDSDNDDAGSPTVWQDWGFCQAEVPGGCQPGTNTNEDCGFCGTRNKVCQNDCTYAAGSCQNQPVNGCAPGSTDFQVGLSCETGGRQRTCSVTCVWGNVSSCFIPDPGVIGPALTISDVAGAVVSGNFNLDMATTTGRLGSFDLCPAATVGSLLTPYQYVQIVNTTSKTATVSVWSSKAAGEGAPEIATIMATYAGPTPPVTPAQRSACQQGVVRYCNDRIDPTSCLNGWAGMMKADSKQITVKPYSSLFVYVAANNASTATLPQFGPYVLSARTESIR